jgi:hypothetical protein
MFFLSDAAVVFVLLPLKKSGEEMTNKDDANEQLRMFFEKLLLFFHEKGRKKEKTENDLKLDASAAHSPS